MRDRAIPPRRPRWPWSATRMPRCGIRRSGRSPTQRHWRLEMMAKEACPMMDVHVSNPFRRLVEHLQHCQQWRGEVMARLKAPAPATGRGERLARIRSRRNVDRFQRIRSGVDRQPDPGGAAAARHRREGACARSVPDPRAGVPICLSGHLDDVAACAPHTVDGGEPTRHRR